MSQLNTPIPFRLLKERFHKLRGFSWFDLFLKTGLVLLFSSVIVAAWRMGALFGGFNELYANPICAFLLEVAAVYSVILLTITLIRVLMVARYRPMSMLRDEDLPSVSVIIPAFNEGADVGRAIDSIAHSHYPRQKLQIIVVDDGSTDDTWFHIEAAARQHPDVVCTVRMDKNGGKRQGLRVGFSLAAGDVLVTMDSDSVVERHALASLVTPLVMDPRIGAVAGNVKVQNRNAGILPRMMRASFVLAFDFTRAYQSQIRSVLCTPGAFSAYRRSAVETVLNDWNHQTFMGKPSTIGEDRALGNLLLREGHEIVFQSDAVVWTNVPTSYKQMAQMYQRWERGNVRENLTYGTFCWKEGGAFRKRYRLAANAEWLFSCADMVVPPFLIVASLIYGLINPFFMLKYLSFIIMFSAVMQAYYWKRERDSDCIYGVLYSLFWFTALWWVVPYSILTANNGSWMTRTLPGRSQPAISPSSSELTTTPNRLAA